MEVRTTIEALAIPPEALEALARSLLESPDGLSELVPGAVLAVETGERQIDHPDGSFTSEIRLTAEFPEGAHARRGRGRGDGPQPRSGGSGAGNALCS